MHVVACEAVRFFDLDTYPGWVELRLVDAHGKPWTVIDKIPIFFYDDPGVYDNPEVKAPIPAAIACEIVAVRPDGNGGEIVTVATDIPGFHVTAVDDASQFDVTRDQLREKT
jgi:hypothetical protein